MTQDLVEECLYQIHQKLSKTSSISFEDLLMTRSIVRIEKLASGDSFMRPGESSQKVAIILKGLAKTYYVTENGKEYITHFADEGSFLGVYTDMLKNTPSTGYIQTLEPCTLVVMNYQELLNVTKENISWAHMLRQIAESRYIYRSEKDRNITLKTAQERYEYFIKTHSSLVDRLPQHQIALYLNLTAATLSRLKNQSGNYKK